MCYPNWRSASSLAVFVDGKQLSDCLMVWLCWLQHSLGIVHTPSWRPFVPSSVAVYVDGKQLSDSAFKFPDLNNVRFVVCALYNVSLIAITFFVTFTPDTIAIVCLFVFVFNNLHSL